MKETCKKFYEILGLNGGFAMFTLESFAHEIRNQVINNVVDVVNQCREDGETDLRSVRERIQSLKE